MCRVRIDGCVFGLSLSCFLLLAGAQLVTNPVEVHALLAVKSNLVDSKGHLKSWKKGDPCTSNWTGVVCFDAAGLDGYLHIRELQLLDLGFSGSLAPELGQLSHLEILDFMWNDLTGSIPKEIGNISTLRLLLLNGNKLSGPLPAELGNLRNLNRLQIDQNNISGPIPTSFANLSSVKHLHFNNNSLSCQIPSELSKLSTLIHILVDNNNLSGKLPPELSRLPDLRILQLDNNNFDGEIPDTYANFSKLAKLSLRNCKLRGAIPDFGQIPQLSYLDLSMNYFSGPIPTNKLSDNMTTIDLSHNHLNGSIPPSFSQLPYLQRLSLENNFLSGSVPANLWQKLSFTASDKLLLDLRNNSLSFITGHMDLPKNVTLRLQGNPVCKNASTQQIAQVCIAETGPDERPQSSRNSTATCPIDACPTDSYFEYVKGFPVPCHCASPLRIGYRLKSPSFSYFAPYVYPFEKYLTSCLHMDLYQISIESSAWEKGPRLRMYLKLFPSNSSVFNMSEVRRLRGIFASWTFPGNDFYGPYELLNFTLLGPYKDINTETERVGLSKGVWVAVILGTIFCALATLAILTFLIVRRRSWYQQSLSRKHSSSKVSIKIDGVKCFNYKEVARATENFSSSTLIGRGGYGKVYKGILPDNTVLAIKRAEEGSLQGQREFLTEIKLLSRLHHRNLVSLIGYCDEEGEQMLVYEFMSHGTLLDWLSDKTQANLSFCMRLRIALGSSKGILYLHTEADPPVFHRDIKGSNILLDSKLTAKVADFGLSRLAPVLDDEGTVPNYVSTVVKGTPGYVDPEYMLAHKLTDKSDVYSLGVVFLELLTGMRAIYHGKNIVREVNTAYEEGRMFSIVDSRMGPCLPGSVERFVELALWCCNDKPENRPSMLDVVRELESILQMMLAGKNISPEESISTEFGRSQSSSSSFLTRGHFISSSEVPGSEVASGEMHAAFRSL